MASAVVQNAGNSGTATTVVASLATTTTSGNLLLVAITSNFDSFASLTGVTDNKSNTYTQIGTPVTVNNGTLRFYYCANIAGGAGHTVTATFSGSGQSNAIYVREYSGIATATPFDQTAAGSGSASALTTAATPTTTVASELVVAVGFQNLNTAAFTAGSGYANLTQFGYGQGVIAFESKDVAVTGTQTGTMTSGTSWNYGIKVATFKLAASGSNFSNPLSDSVTSSDSLIKNIVLNKSDSITSSDSFIRVATFIRSLADSVTSSDAIIKNAKKALADNVTPTEGFSIFRGAKLTFADSVTASDAIVKKAVKAFSDAVTSSEGFSRSAGFVRSLSDSATSSDTIIKKLVLNKADSAISTDAIVKNITVRKGDTVTSTDSVLKAIKKLLADSVTSSDSLSSSAIVLRIFLNDTVTANESIAKKVAKTLNDSVILSESYAVFIPPQFMPIIATVVTTVSGQDVNSTAELATFNSSDTLEDVSSNDYEASISGGSSAISINSTDVVT